jgi:hypothetical protein
VGQTNTNKYKNCIEDNIPTSLNFTWDQISFVGHIGLTYIQSLNRSQEFMPLKAMAYSNQIKDSSPSYPRYQPPGYIYNFPYISLQV